MDQKIRNWRRLLGMQGLLATIVACGVSIPAAAQERSNGGLEEVIVTAQRRAENLQTVPLALSSFSGNYLQREKVEDVSELGSRVPGLQYEQFSPGEPRFFIRGLGSISRSSAVDGDVGVFMDDVYLGRPEMTNINFYDLENLEILRGPQGTLFGRNVVGGAVSYHTKRPTDELKILAQVGYGNFNTFETAATITGPLTDKVSAKLSAGTRNHDGYNFNQTTRHDVEDERFIGASGAIRFRPTDDLDIQLNGDFSRRRGTGPWWILYREAADQLGKAYPDPRNGKGYTDDGFANIDNNGVSLNANWTTAYGTLTSITAYRDSMKANRSNTTGLYAAQITDPPAVIAANSNIVFLQEDDQWSDQFSQELRFASPSGERLTWVGGLYYFEEHVKHDFYVDYRFLFPFFKAQGQSLFKAHTNTRAYAGFANGSYKIFDTLSVQAGVRWSRDEKDHVLTPTGVYTNAFTINGVKVPTWTAQGQGGWNAVTPTASLKWQVTPDKLLYFTYSKGFKSGGFNDNDLEYLSATTPFNPEYVENYEVGAKTEWFDHRLRVNLAAYDMRYTDLQVVILIPATNVGPSRQVTGNAGSALSQGVELELNWLPTDELSFLMTYNYAHTRIDQLVVVGVNQAGNQLTRSPRHKLFLGANYAKPLANDMTATARVGWSYQTKYFTGTDNAKAGIVPTQRNLDAGVGLELQGGRWFVELWGKNLTDSIKPVFPSPVGDDAYSALMPPRTYGVSVRYKF
jgi:iron complex outermembrane recepter protein